MTISPATLNHVAISVPRADLDDEGRAAILAFYGEVFGWSELPDQDEPGDPLILATGAFGQFVHGLAGRGLVVERHGRHGGGPAQVGQGLGAVVVGARRCCRVGEIGRHVSDGGGEGGGGVRSSQALEAKVSSTL